jgi:hypothetical protein
LRAAREKFASLLATTETREAEYQQLFSDCPFVLSRSLGLTLKPSDIIPLGRPGKAEPDFIYYPREQASPSFFGVIELKRHDSKILGTPRKQLITLSRSAATAIRQGQMYVERLQTTLSVNPSSTLFIGDPSLIFVIMGLSNELIKKITPEITKQQFLSLIPQNCRIIPYDQLLARFEETIPPRVLCLTPALIPSNSPARVIFLDDDRATLNALMHSFTKRFSTSSITLEAYYKISDFVEAVSNPNVAPPDVCVLDIWLAPASSPESGGFLCAEILRSNPRMRNVPIAFFTGIYQDDLMAKFQAIAPPTRFFEKSRVEAFDDVFTYVSECIGVNLDL